MGVAVGGGRAAAVAGVAVVRRNPGHAEILEDGDDGEVVALIDQRGPLSSLKQCPYCAKDMQHVAMVCQHCGRDWKTGVSQNEDRELDKISMSDDISTSRPRRPSGQMVATGYLAVVAAFLMLGFGSSNVMLDRIFAPLVIYLTMPFSMLSGLFVWSEIHGGSQGPTVAVIAMSALVNAFMIGWGVDQIRRNDDVRRRSRVSRHFHAGPPP